MILRNSEIKIADKIVNLVDKILRSKAQGKDSPPCHLKRSEVSQKQKRDFSLASLPQNDKIISNLESKIDDLVYALYDLTQDEIKIIQSN